MAMKLCREMYGQARTLGITVSELLAQENPSEEANLDAFEFALMKQDINLRKHTVERFYRTQDDIYLFPEFINRNVRIGLAGLTAIDLTLEDVVATETTIDSGVYDTFKAVYDEKKLDFSRIAEGGMFPSVSITSAKNSVRLAKIGLKLNASYEVLRRMKLPLFAAHLQLIGQRIAKRNVAFAMYNINNGDGNDNAAPATEATPLSYSKLLEFYLNMDRFAGTVFAAKKTEMSAILNLPEFQTPYIFKTAATGEFATPFGLPLKRFNWTESALGNNQITIVSKSAALELVKESGAELIETEKVIDKQLQDTVISNVIGFSRIFPDGAKVFTIGEDEE
ncbi:hypothetical protein [Geobacter sp. SVR]|uniref:phage major capsid protein n=1 Tax=Geobacter sp. SVR TaxID=2495594 RepID=UPI00143EF5C8|nr:hypothetical protein [Geobacter sp. SVR]BCS55190.1 hypothetical protein GSVR_34980 [Geobacter sp. SVR]GCF85991.1 hypothetical protein GSbR_25910 [Geobacter sp. SVR]